MRLFFLMLTACSILLVSCSSGNTACDGAKRLAQQEWDAAVEDAKVCQSDADCGTARSDPGFSVCGTAVNKTEIDQIEALDDILVNRLAECGITLTADCGDEERPAPECVQNRCIYP